MRDWRAVGAALLLAATAGCGLPRTVELEGFALWDKPVADAPHVHADVTWARKIGRGKPERFAKLRPERVGDVVLLADQDGWVTAYDAARGKPRWTQHFNASFRSGPHYSGDQILLETRR